MNDFLPVADQLKLLFDQVQHPEGRPYTLQEVSQATGVSLPTLSQLRTGKIRNPQLQTLREICRFFKVPLRYFETRSIEECYAILAGEDSPNIAPLNEIAFRIAHLSPQSQQDILTIIQWVQAAEEQGKAAPHLGSLPNLDNDPED